MNPRSVSLFVVSLLATLSASLCAHEGPEQDLFTFTVMAFGDSMFEGIRFENAKGDFEELSFDPYGRSRAYRVDSDERDLEFFSEVTRKGKVSHQRIGRFDASSMGYRGLLVFYPNYQGQGDLRYQIIGVDESDANFGPGAFRFLNLTGTGLLSRIAEEEQLLETGFSDVFRFDSEDRKPISFQFAAKVKEKWKLVYATKRQSDKRRGTLFILKPPSSIDSLKIRVHALVETLP